MAETAMAEAPSVDTAAAEPAATEPAAAVDERAIEIPEDFVATVPELAQLSEPEPLRDEPAIEVAPEVPEAAEVAEAAEATEAAEAPEIEIAALEEPLVEEPVAAETAAELPIAEEPELAESTPAAVEPAAVEPAAVVEAPAPEPAPVPELAESTPAAVEPAAVEPEAVAEAPAPEPAPVAEMAAPVLPDPGTTEVVLVPAEARPPEPVAEPELPPEAMAGAAVPAGAAGEEVTLELPGDLPQEPAGSSFVEPIPAPTASPDTSPAVAQVEPAVPAPVVPEPVVIESAAIAEVPAPEPVAPAAGAERNPVFKAPLIEKLEKGKYYLQLGAWSAPETVASEIAKFIGFYPVAVEAIRTGTRPVYKLLIGPLNLGEGGALVQRFKSIGYKDVFVKQGI